MTKYIKSFPKPLLDDLVNGRWLPVVGAGMSRNAVLPKGAEMPLWGDLGKAFEADLSDFSATSPVDAISAYEHEFGRARLVDRLSELLHVKDAKPGAAHRAFCSIKFDLVCTTNFDFLLEKQYGLTPRYVSPVVDEEQLSLNGVRDGTLLLKLHGDLHHPSRLVVTEEDYDAFLTNYPLIATFLANLLITKTAVLIGFSLDDPDFRQVWQVVNQRLGKTRRQAYAIAVGAQKTDVARFARRGVTLINLPKAKKKGYGEILEEAFDELAEYWRNHVLDVSTVIEEAPLRELILPKNASSRLVYFSVPLQRLPIYRNRVFPAVEDLGLVPVTSDDVVSPNDTIGTKIDALMERAGAIVIELGSSATSAELRQVLNHVRNSIWSDGQRAQVILIEREAPISSEEKLDRTFVTRIASVTDSDDGLEVLVKALKPLLVTEENRAEEAIRLLSAGEYRAAVVSAIGLLEDGMRRSLDKPVWSSVRRPMSMRQLIDLCFAEKGLPYPAEIKDWVQVRNRAVHENTQVSRAEAEDIVQGVQRLLNDLEHR